MAANFWASTFSLHRMNGNEVNRALHDKGHRNLPINHQRSLFGYCKHGLLNLWLSFEKSLVFENCSGFSLSIKLRQRLKSQEPLLFTIFERIKRRIFYKKKLTQIQWGSRAHFKMLRGRFSLPHPLDIIRPNNSQNHIHECDSWFE